MASRTLLSLRDRAKQRANMENSTFVSDSEWNNYLNYSISELRDIITSKVGDDYFATSTSISLLSSTDTYSLPEDFYKVLWVEILADDGYYYKMKRFEISELNANANVVAFAVPDIRYRIRANDIWFNPQGALGGRTVRLWYVPLAAELSNDSDELVGYNGWDEYPVLRSAIMALEKEEQDTSSLSIRLEQLRLRIEAMAENRDQAQPMRIQDTERVEVAPWL
jgi:hypothetical protein